MTTKTDVDAFLEHHGVKGMKWGVRKDRGHEGQRAKTKKIAKLDAKFEKNSTREIRKIITVAQAVTIRGDLPRINNKSEYRSLSSAKPSDKLWAKYDNEVRLAFGKNLNIAAKDSGSNASGTRNFKVVSKSEDGMDVWDVVVGDVKHAEDNFRVEVVRDASGFITSFSMVAPIGSPDDEEALEHHGVKGMKWGVRRDRSELRRANAGKADATTQKKSSQDSGGAKPDKGDEDGSQAATSQAPAGKNSLSGRRGTKIDITSLSDNELRDLVNRINTEKTYAKLTAKEVSSGKKFVKDLTTNVATTQATRVANRVVGNAVDRALGLDAASQVSKKSK